MSGDAGDAGDAGARGGLVVRYGVRPDADELGFIPIEIVKRVTELTGLRPVPGAGASVAGLALADGAVVTVLRLGRAPVVVDGSREPMDPGADRAVLCALGTFDVALVGGVVVATGLFETASDGGPDGQGVLLHGEVVPPLDVRALYAEAHAAIPAARAASRQGPRVSP